MHSIGLEIIGRRVLNSLPFLLPGTYENEIPQDIDKCLVEYCLKSAKEFVLVTVFPFHVFGHHNVNTVKTGNPRKPITQ